MYMQVVKKSQAGAGVAVKIEHAVYQSAKLFGRHFDEKDELYSHITRQSIDVLKVRTERRLDERPLTMSLSDLIQGRRLKRRMAAHQSPQAGESWLVFRLIFRAEFARIHSV